MSRGRRGPCRAGQLGGAKAKYAEELIANGKKIATPGKGILAADESTGTIGKRLASIGCPNEAWYRRDLREMLFTSASRTTSAAWCVPRILFEETLYQNSSDGTPFVKMLQDKDILRKYYEQGARFAKWRAVLKIGNGCPSELSIHQNAYTLARYAVICQENGLVPIVEPEILSDGSHGIEVCAAITERVVAACYKALNDHHALLEGTLLKPNMVLAGAEGPKADLKLAGYLTARTLMRTVPAAVPGIMFLSGGQSEEEATAHLAAMNQCDNVNTPWTLSFSFGRALQASALKAWGGKKENFKAGQDAFLARAKANSESSLGAAPAAPVVLDNSARRTYTFCGTPGYVAPENVLAHGYNHSVDWWGLGVLTYLLLTGRQRFSSPKTDDPMVVMRRIVDDSFQIKFPPYVSPAAKDFVQRLLERKSTKRLGMLQGKVRDVKQHRWFESFDWEALAARKLADNERKQRAQPKETPEELAEAEAVFADF
ncbi:hypothetical protein ABPG75_012118 [Micractinium tetrahymenae]